MRPEEIRGRIVFLFAGTRVLNNIPEAQHRIIPLIGGARRSNSLDNAIKRQLKPFLI